MIIKKKTVLDQIEITRDGTVQVRIALLLLEGDAEIDSKWHRTGIPPGHDIDAQMAAVNRDLESMNKEPLLKADIDKIKVQAYAAWTSDVIGKYEASLKSGNV